MVGQFKRAAASLHGRLLIGAALLTVLAGCGTEIYEQRLQATQRLYEHIQLLDDNLSREWSNGVLSIRMPSQFVEIPPPAAPAPPDPNNPTTEPPAATPDLRKPDYAPLELNGLKAAFKADLRLDGGSSKPGYIYVISNHDFPNREAAKDLKQQLAQELSSAFKVPIEKWEEEQYPIKTSDMFPSVHYHATTITPTEDIGGFPRRVTVLFHQNGEVHTFIVLVLPQKIDNSSERINDRVPLTLETLLVSSDQIQVPGQPAPADAGPSGTPAASGPAPSKGF